MKLYRCPEFEAWIQPPQCEINRKRASKRRRWNARSKHSVAIHDGDKLVYSVCAKCPGAKTLHRRGETPPPREVGEEQRDRRARERSGG